MQESAVITIITVKIKFTKLLAYYTFIQLKVPTYI